MEVVGAWLRSQIHRGMGKAWVAAGRPIVRDWQARCTSVSRYDGRNDLTVDPYQIIADTFCI